MDQDIQDFGRSGCEAGCGTVMRSNRCTIAWNECFTCTVAEYGISSCTV